MADHRDPRQEPRDPDWRVWGEEYPPVPVRAANSDGRTFNDVARRPLEYVPYLSLIQRDGRHGYNPDNQYPAVQPPRFPSPDVPARFLPPNQRPEVFEPPIRDSGLLQMRDTLQRLNGRADHFLRGTSGLHAPMPQLSQRPRSPALIPMSRNHRSESPDRWSESRERRPRSPVRYRSELFSEGPEPDIIHPPDLTRRPDTKFEDQVHVVRAEIGETMHEDTLEEVPEGMAENEDDRHMIFTLLQMLSMSS